MTSPSIARVAAPLKARPSAAPILWRALMGIALLAVSGVLAVDRWGAQPLAPWIIPAVAYLLSLGLVWSPLDGAFGQDARRLDLSRATRRDTWIRLGVGLVLGVGAMWWFATWRFTESNVVRAIVVPLAIAAAAALLLAPWWLRLIRQISVERQERIREHERAEIAAHLHDSVLQTLTLIRANAADPDAVARLARAQERDLRTYLYEGASAAEASVAAALRAAVAGVEDSFGVTIDVVCVGDAPPTEPLNALVQAAREAVANAARHATGPLSVYAEATASAYEIFVRDGGPGFDVAAVPEDRLGIRHSIKGRVKRHGGAAEVISEVGGRTEVVLSMPRKEQA